MRVIGGIAKGRIIKTEKREGLRPTSSKVKGAFFNILGPKIINAIFLDLFAGSGNVGIEALSRGAHRCVFVEKSAKYCKIIKDNTILTGLEHRAYVMQSSVFSAIKKLRTCEQAFNYIFMDPPYNRQLVSSVLRFLGENKLLIEGGTVIVEHHLLDADVKVKNDFFKIVRQKKYSDNMLTFLEWI